jgi:1,4-dihydroxy-6-naphthoate synthase
MFSLELGLTPRPHDVFLIQGLIRDRIESPLIFEPVRAGLDLLDVWAVEERLEVSRLSLAGLVRAGSGYGLLLCGAVLGPGWGPLVVAREGDRDPDWTRVAAARQDGVSALVLALCLGREPGFVPLEGADPLSVLEEGRASLALVRGRSRFQVRERGLPVVLDLGRWWEEETGQPLPLEVMACRRDLGQEMARSVDLALRQSLTLAFSEPEAALKGLQELCPGFNDRRFRDWLKLHLNSFSPDLGPDGLAAVEALIQRARKAGLAPESHLPLEAY